MTIANYLDELSDYAGSKALWTRFLKNDIFCCTYILMLVVNILLPAAIASSFPIFPTRL